MLQMISKSVVNVYIGLVADATIELKNKDGKPVEEVYRFMYDEI